MESTESEVRFSAKIRLPQAIGQLPQVNRGNYSRRTRATNLACNPPGIQIDKYVLRNTNGQIYFRTVVEVAERVCNR